MTKLLNFLAREVRVRRREAGLSQEDLAEKTNISVALISEIERGIANPTLQTLEKIASYFDISVQQLLSSEESSEITSYIKLRIISKILVMDDDKLDIALKFIAKL